MKKTQLFNALVSFSLIVLLVTACSKEKDPTATINVLSTSGNKSGDVTGNGGTASKTWKFNNSGTTAGWDMSQDATSGSFQLVLKDATGTIKLDKTLTAGSGAQSADGTTPAGTAGEWTAIVTLTNFNGSGDYSFR